jgi:hypothetical protein
MAEYALAVDLGSEVTAAVSDDAGHRIVPIGDAGQLALPVTVDGVGRLLVGDTTAQPAADEPDGRGGPPICLRSKIPPSRWSREQRCEPAVCSADGVPR